MSRIFLALALLVAGAAPAWSQLQVAPAPSLNLAPANCAFYGVNLRSGEQWQKIANSNAVKRLLASSYVQLGLQELKNNLENESELQELRRIYELPENQELVKVLAEGASEELFVYGDEKLGGIFQLLNRFSGAMRAAQIEAISNGGDEEAAKQHIIQFLLDNEASLRVPEVVIGLRIRDRAAAQRQLDRLRQVAPLLQGSPLDGALQEEQVGGAKTYTLTIKGSMIPAEELEKGLKDFDSPEGKQAGEKMIRLIRSRTLAISASLRDNYLVLSVGESSAHLAKLGQQPTLLQNPRLKVLAKHANQRLLGISYTSGKFLEAVSSADSQLRDAAQMLVAGVSVAPVGENIKTAVKQDAKRLVDSLIKAIPKPGDLLAVNMESPQGYEAFSYNWGEHHRNARKPLTILDHVGGNPLLFAAGRGTQAPANPEGMKVLMERLEFYLNELVLPNLDGQQQQMARDLLAGAKPLIAEAGRISRDLYRPAVADAQGALVLDAKLLSAQPHRSMPRPANQLPLPEAAIVIGVSDEQKMMEAMTAYFNLGDKAIDAARKVFPQVPPFKMPRPIGDTIEGVELYSYPISFLLGLDMSIAPNGGIGNGVAVASLMPNTTARLISNNPLKSPSSVLKSHQDQPLAAAFGIDFKGMISAVREWADYGIALNEGDPSAAVVRAELHTILDVLSCLQYIGGATYQEGDALVTHTESIFKDLPN
ncbi:MAG: hypothetical protein KDB14_24020 [Planctomycetales bacterium]|nr:hypothetical protein [Planctomycetales bacterium]